MKFLNPHQDLGNTVVGRKHTITFRFDESITVTQVTLSCGCTSEETNNTTKVIVVSYKAKPIPEHFVLEGKVDYITTKTVEVKYKDTNYPGQEMVETLTFKAHVFKP